jgi:hypothetical protein
MDTPTRGDSCYTAVELGKYWVIISLFLFRPREDKKYLTLENNNNAKVKNS